MTIQRMEHVGIVVDDLEAATAFFVELGLKLQGEGQVEGGWVDRVVGLEGVRVEYAMVETPGRPHLMKAPPRRGFCSSQGKLAQRSVSTKCPQPRKRVCTLPRRVPARDQVRNLYRRAGRYF